MDKKICPKVFNCNIFQGILKDSEYTKVYKKLYCEAGEEARKRCRRFQVATIMGYCPPNILPNSTKTVDEIVAEMKEAAAE